MKSLGASLMVGLLVAGAVIAAGCSSRELVRTGGEDRAAIVSPSAGLMPEVVVTAERSMLPEVVVAAPRFGGRGEGLGLELMFRRPERVLPYVPPLAD